MTILLTDTFSGAGQIDNGSTWDSVVDSIWTAGSGAVKIASGSLSSDWHVDAIGATWPADHYAQVTLASPQASGAGTGYGPAVRLTNSGGGTFYRLIGNASGYELGKVVAGSFSTITGSQTGTTFANGDLLRLEVTGTGTVTLKMYKGAGGGSLVQFGGDQTDSSSAINTGHAGMCYSSTEGTTPGIDAFEGGDFVGGGSPALTVENATLTSTGQTITFASNVAVSEATATFTGQTLTFVESVGIAVTSATLTISGQNVDLLANANVVLPVTNAQMALEGQELPFQLSVPWTEPTLALTGQTITLTAGVPVILAVTEANLTFAGQTINFILDEDFTLPVTNATMAFTGQDVTLSALTSFIVTVTNAQATFAGQDVGMFTPYATGTGGGRKCRDRAITRLLNFGR